MSGGLHARHFNHNIFCWHTDVKLKSNETGGGKRNDYQLIKMSSKYMWSNNKFRELMAIKSATYLIGEYYCGRHWSTSLGKLRTDASG
jgi:hypothetical protein